uniref:Zinc transporter n=1 Tax=Angiostrongylus cantonensis TaxID=6313 RepID=A0A0K0DGT7_ANGCA
LMSQIDAQSECAEVDMKKSDTVSQNSKKVMLMIVITFLFFFVELVVGFMNRSIALLADSYHMLSDVMALVIAFVCLRISRHKSKRNGFGWVRAEVLGALVNGVFLLAMCFTISLESIGRIIHPRSISHPLQVLVVGCIGLLINMIGIGMFHGGHGHSHGSGGHSHDVKKVTFHDILNKYLLLAKLPDGSVRLFLSLGDTAGGRIPRCTSPSDAQEHLLATMRGLIVGVPDAQNLNMRGVFLHILSDAIGSLFVIVTASVALFFPAALGPISNYLDPALSLTLVTLICFSAYALVKETAGIILRRTPPFIDLEYIKADIMKVFG